MTAISPETLRHLHFAAGYAESGWIGDAVGSASMFHDQVRRPLGETHEVTATARAYLSRLLAEHYSGRNSLPAAALRAAYLTALGAVTAHNDAEQARADRIRAEHLATTEA